MASAFARGLVVGVLVAAPIGPMAMLAIRRTLDRGFPEGLASGLGIASADALYAAVAAFGLAAVSGVLLHQGRLISALGGLIVALLGVRGLLAPRSELASRPTPGGLSSAYGSSLLLTLGNPPTILTFAALIAAIGSAAAGPAAAAAVVAGVFVGSALWWLVLTGAAARAGRALTPRLRLLISRAAAVALLGLGLVLLVRALLTG